MLGEWISTAERIDLNCSDQFYLHDSYGNV